MSRIPDFRTVELGDMTSGARKAPEGGREPWVTGEQIDIAGVVHRADQVRPGRTRPDLAEHDLALLCPQRFEFRYDLSGIFQSRNATERDDDVAKFALKGAATRELQAAEHVVLHLQ